MPAGSLSTAIGIEQLKATTVLQYTGSEIIVPALF